MTPTGSRSASSGRSDLRWSQLRTGAVLLAVLAVALTAIFLSDVVLRELSEGPAIVVTAAEARDLEPGSAVWVAGLPAGRVTAVRFRETGAGGRRPVVVRAVLGEEAAGTLRADAAARIRAAALLAPAVVAIRPGRAERPFRVGDTLRAEPRIGQEEIRARADSLARELRGLAPLSDSLRRRLEEGPGTLAALRRDDALGSELRRAGDQAMGLAARIPEGTAARLASDTAARASLARTARLFRRLAGHGRRAAGRADSLRRELARLADRLDGLGRRLDDGRGTLGRLLGDEALRRERRRVEAQMDSLRSELLAHPLRWLRIGLF